MWVMISPYTATPTPQRNIPGSATAHHVKTLARSSFPALIIAEITATVKSDTSRYFPPFPSSKAN